MVIHGAGYRRIDYEPTSTFERIRPLAIHEWRVIFRRIPGVLLFVACLGPSIFNVFLLLLQAGIWEFGDLTRLTERSPRLDPNAMRFYLDPILGESYLPVLILTTLVGCRAIAKDRAAGALEILWTRGITPVWYFVGRWLGSVLLLAVPCVVAPLVLWILAVLSAPDWQLLSTTIEFMPRLLLAATAYVMVVAYLAVGFSAVAGTPTFASILWMFLLVGSAAMGRVLAHVFPRDAYWKGLSPVDSAQRLVRAVVGDDRVGESDPIHAVVFLALVVVPLTVLVRRRLRLGEAVG